jgi:phosphatidylethanolamine/phosphatidyl-N-methylethanolamine N-methyltransferase
MQNEDNAWIDYQNGYSIVYDENNYSSPLQAKCMMAGHKLLEAPFGPQNHFSNVLEIGAGTGQHHLAIRHSYDRYILTDNLEDNLQVARSRFSDIDDGKLEFMTQAGGDLPYPDSTFDRVIATHVLEHIYQPHLAIKEWLRIIKPGGVLSILIPTDPGLAWRLGRRLGPRKKAIALGIPYDYIMAREHVNPCNNLIALLRYYCPLGTEAWWPLPLPSLDLNLFFAFNASITKE